jgi:hypothetical protein
MSKSYAPIYSVPEFKGELNKYTGLTVRLYRRTISYEDRRRPAVVQWKVTINEPVFDDNDERWQWESELGRAAGISLLEIAGWDWG